MMNKCISQIGEIKYYMKAEVYIIRIWDCFHLAEIKEVQSQRCLIVDICTLSDQPNYSKSISLWLLGGSK